MIPQTVTSRTDDRILGSTRVVAALIIPFLVAAFVILYLLPDSTDRLFAWTIVPRMSALLMGAGYASGIYFFTRVVRAPRWHWCCPFCGCAIAGLILGHRIRAM